MWLKLIGSILVVTAATYCGFSLSRRCSERPQQLRQMISCIVSLKSYINYVSLPLPEALIKSTAGTDGAVAALFTETAAVLENNVWMKPQQAIAQALSSLEPRLALDKPEREILAMLGANLGSLNREEQSNYLDMIQEQLEKLEQEAVRSRDLNTKMYRYLGICSGLVIVILLV
ncbi:stage III sporulation protein AB|uniref:Stage III sporulation protein AB n=1 Tax=Dendrosporobacter quercicolus TaxID=146817 RepID=A0A1G9KWJ3_9FIRM|nr:stage III sporulation protein AB [Dendrosporobacter quercicolus]NSL46519.1 stage III sporulation protein AB [Dendrosporobacter quercicolus DSM 1736]SDL53999.1 stage III sporulation protein AB [Dendrosporobacter quercicolus]